MCEGIFRVTFGRFAAAAEYFANPSVKPSANGMPLGHGRRYAKCSRQVPAWRPTIVARDAQSLGICITSDEPSAQGRYGQLSIGVDLGHPARRLEGSRGECSDPSRADSQCLLCRRCRRFDPAVPPFPTGRQGTFSPPMSSTTGVHPRIQSSSSARVGAPALPMPCAHL